jgi:RNA polymerase sigma-70 factor (ECF subfamily)
VSGITRDELAGYYERFGPVVHRRARALLGTDDEARDAMQEVFLKVVAGAAGFRHESAPLSWIYQITTNVCLNRIRQRRAHPVIADPAMLEALAHGGEAHTVDRAAVLHVLAALDDDVRRIAIHYFIDEMSMDEVALTVGSARNTVSKKLELFRRRALALLTERIDRP